MPFRAVGERRELLELYNSLRRTGEPSPSTEQYEEFHRLMWQVIGKIWENDNDYIVSGHGKSRGSFTEKMRNALLEWMKQNHTGTITFEYKLSRKRTVLVTGSMPWITHDKQWGNGRRGFVLSLHVHSIDGLRPNRFGRRGMLFAWNRIIGRERLLELPGV